VYFCKNSRLKVLEEVGADEAGVAGDEEFRV
jgi:hypothetical protein